MIAEKLAIAIAPIAEALPEKYPSREEVLKALAKIYRRGWNDALTLSACDLAIALGSAQREKKSQP